MEHVLKEGITLSHDYYLCFSGDEETRGPSANNIVKHLKAQGVTPSLVLDEGGAVVEDIFPGVKKKTAVIGVAEKGYMNVRLSSKASGGHASMPPASMPLSDLAKAVSRLHHGNLFKMQSLSVTKDMLKTVSKHSESYVMRLVFANLWLFMPVIKMNAKKSGGEMLSLFRTTQAFTMAEGSNAMNVLPSEASIGVNYRLLQGNTINDTLSRIKKRIKNDTIEVSLEKGAEATTISKTTGSYDTLTQTIKETWGDIITTPYLMMAGTDSRYHHAISDHVYRFSPMEMTKAERKTIHSTEEAIRIDHLLTCVRFYIRLIKNINKTT
jgi:carboxypeptidase PM20D1